MSASTQLCQSSSFFQPQQLNLLSSAINTFFNIQFGFNSQSMKQLESALKRDKLMTKQQSKLQNQTAKSFRGKSMSEMWCLDPDFIENPNETVNQRLTEVIKTILKNKYENQKYLQEQTFMEVIQELGNNLKQINSELERLVRIEQILFQLSETYFGDIKNYIKHFQSLLDAKIRKLKKKEKKNDLLEFDKIAKKQKMMKKKNQVLFINEDIDEKKYLKRKDNLAKLREKNVENESRRSYGTMNSGSNQNESGGSANSGKNKSGSNSKSGQAKALAVLLANIERPQEKKIQKLNQSYNFSSLMSASVAVRKRNNKGTQASEDNNKSIKSQAKLDEKILIDEEAEKDEAFIFHRPKKSRK